MANLSEEKRIRMLSFLKSLREVNKDDATSLRAINEIEQVLNEKKYGLVWEEHIEQVDELAERNVLIFNECRSKQIRKENNKFYNFLLEGDNLHSLKLLEKTHKGKIKVIYIDPPYNTGNKDFKYNDQFVDSNDSYAHSKWLSFMSVRLKIAKKLLSDDGIIFISIDDNEQAPLKLLCDEIFGDTNFIGQLHWKRKKQPSYLHGNIASVMEYITVFAKNRAKAPKLAIDTTTDSTTRVDNASNQASVREIKAGIRVKLASDIVCIPKGVYKNKTMTTEFLDDVYIENGRTKNSFRAVAKYRDSQERINQFCDEDVFFITRNYSFRRDKLQSDLNNRKAITDLLLDWGDNQDADKEFKALVKSDNFSYPKPSSLIYNLIKSYGENDITVLDFFAGSGTTGHAVARLNSDDGGQRKYILCTNNENNICEEVTYQRLANIQNELPHNLKYFKTGFISKEVNVSLLDDLLDYIRPLVELENTCDIDNSLMKIFLSEDEFDLFMADDIDIALTRVFLASDIFLSSEQEQKLVKAKCEIIRIPEYYYRDELIATGDI